MSLSGSDGEVNGPTEWLSGSDAGTNGASTSLTVPGLDIQNEGNSCLDPIHLFLVH